MINIKGCIKTKREESMTNMEVMWYMISMQRGQVKKMKEMIKEMVQTK
jgi:hypothetical protein